MIKKRKKIKRTVYVLDSKNSKEYRDILRNCCKEIYDNQLTLVIDCGDTMRHLPHQYDAYLLHLSELYEEDVVQLRKEQPEAIIYMVGGALTIPFNLVKIIDGNWNYIELPVIAREIVEGRNVLK